MPNIKLNVDESVVDYLKSIGQDSSYANRAKLAGQYGISGYAGSYDQNVQLLSMLKGQQGRGDEMSSFSNVNDLSSASSLINENQLSDRDSISQEGVPSTRKTTEDIMAEIRGVVAPQVKAPGSPNYTETLLDYRSRYGVNELEEALTDLQSQANDIRLQYQVNKNAETRKPVAMNVIEGRIGEHEQAANERLQMINNSIQTLTSQLQTKYNIIDSLMRTREMDYNSAVSMYDKEFSNNIAIFNAAKGIEDREKSDRERQVDNARANAQIFIAAMNDRGLTYNDMSEIEKTNLIKLGVESGLGANFFSDVMRVSANKDILTTIVSSDDTKATIIYKDGTTKTINTGLPAKSVSSEKDISSADRKRYTFSEINNLLETPNAKTNKGEAVVTDGYLTPAGFLQIVRYGLSEGLTREDIINAYIDRFYIDPKTGEYSDSYGLTQSEMDKYRPY